MVMKIKEEDKDLNYWKKNCEEDYLHTPISVLRYITKLESKVNGVVLDDVSQQRELLIAYSKYLEKQECRGFDCYIDDFIELNSN